MGRKRKQHNIDTAANQFHELDVEYSRNDYRDPYVDVLNQLPPDERAMMILYISTGSNKTAVARMLGCSRNHIHGHIKAIQDKMKYLIKKKNDELY